MSGIKVLKFGGSVFRDERDKKKIGDEIKRVLDHDGSKVIAVVSAMGNTTDTLLDKMGKERKDPRETDRLLAAGEIESAGLIANHLINDRIRARGFTGWQAGIITDNTFRDANIIEINTKYLEEFFYCYGDVAVVAGFQGETKNRDITTLGRNGSDTTAMYLTYYMHADMCVMYKDVDGVYDKDPRVKPNAKLYKTINYKDVLKNPVFAGVIHDKALKLCEKMFEEQNPEIVIRNISQALERYTTICKEATAFYKNGNGR